MKNIYNKIKATHKGLLVLPLTLVALFSCDDFLDREPLDEVSQATFWRTPEQLDAYIVGKYEWLPGSLTDWGMGYYIDDQNSDNMVIGLNHPTWMNGKNNTTPTSGGEWKWGPIREINMFFDNYVLCESPFSEYEHTYGEACFLKALKYHELVRKFGDVPWYSSVISDTDEEALNKARDPRSLVVDSIMNLMDQAVDHLKLRADVGVNRLNKETALILKSRIALFEATWAKYHAGTKSASDVDADKLFRKAIEAYDQFKQMCGGFEGKLYSTGHPESDYYNLFNRFDYADIQEVTLSKKYSEALGIKNNVNVQSWWYGYSNCSYTLDLIRSYLSKEGESIDIMDKSVVSGTGVTYLSELASKLDPRYKQSVFTPGDLLNTVTPGFIDSLFTVPQIHMSEASRNTTTGFAPKKAHNVEGPLINQTDPLVSGISFRIAELMLNYVEAYVELNGSFPDLSDNIDLLRKRVGMPTLTEVKPQIESWWPDYGYPISDNLAIVRQERRIELAGEGYRTDDWKRWRAHKLFDGKRPKGYRYEKEDYVKQGLNIPSIPVDKDGHLDPYAISLNGGTFKFNPERDYLSPIPMDELLINRNLKQNPEWDSPK